jgi:hypothetical protein
MHICTHTHTHTHIYICIYVYGIKEGTDIQQFLDPICRRHNALEEGRKEEGRREGRRVTGGEGMKEGR